MIHYFFYPLFLIIYSTLNKNYLNFDIDKIEIIDYPFISFIIPVHNEEKIIKKKILNLYSLNYPKDKIEIIVVNDCSSDNSVNIIQDLMKEFKNIKLVDMKNRQGKVNAQNEGVRYSKGEYLIFTDADVLLDKNSIINLLKGIKFYNVSCAAGHFVYINQLESSTSFYESLYQKLENKIKELESKFYSLTALSGSLYAIKRDDYIFLDSMFSHDIAMPIYLASKNKKTVFIKESVAFGKSGNKTEEEWKRKIRMFSRIYYFIFKNFKLIVNPLNFNIKFYFSFFSHRLIRYKLPLLHIILFISLIFLKKMNNFFEIIYLLHIIFLIFSLLGLFSNKIKFLKTFYIFYYYLIFLLSMIVGFLRFVLGKTKPYWEVVQNTRNINE
ncbi:MAG: glycosyltransferase [Nitrososphaerota archaeon]